MSMEKAKLAILEYWLAIVLFVLFSVNALGTSILAASAGSVWSSLGTQEKFTICVAVVVNWTGTIMAFLSKAAQRIKATGELLPSGDTK